MFFFCLNVKAAQPYAARTIWFSRKLPGGSGRKNAHPFCKTATEETPVAVIAKLVLLAAESEVSDELLIALIALALDIVEELAALGNHFQESAA